VEDDLDPISQENPAHAFGVAEVCDAKYFLRPVVASLIAVASTLGIVLVVGTVPVLGELMLQMEDTGLVLVEADQSFWSEHPNLTVIGAWRVGRNATILQGVTLGAQQMDLGFDSGLRPEVGDNVLLGAGSKILGGIRIGDNVTVGANAVVVDSIEANSTVVGIPALCISKKTTSNHDIGKLVLQGDERNNLTLDPGDVITIFSQNDLAVPLQKQSKFVRLEGEFKSAGVYRAEAGETVRHLVERVGGLTSNAYLYGAEFTRESVRIEQQKGLDQLIEKLEEDITRNALAPVGGNLVRIDG
jgi:carbonic anhydrase/acetyltransferase-like protein (isoleucine patch superfamily)